MSRPVALRVVPRTCIDDRDATPLMLWTTEARRLLDAPFFDALDLVARGMTIDSCAMASLCEGRKCAALSMWVLAEDERDSKFVARDDTLLRMVLCLTAHAGMTPSRLCNRDDEMLVTWFGQLGIEIGHVRGVATREFSRCGDAVLALDIKTVSDGDHDAQCLTVLQLDGYVVTHAWGRREGCETESTTYTTSFGYTFPWEGVVGARVIVLLLKDEWSSEAPARLDLRVIVRACASGGEICKRAWLLDEARELATRAWPQHGVYQLGKGAHKETPERNCWGINMELDEALAYIEICGDAGAVLRHRRECGGDRWELPRAYWSREDIEEEQADNYTALQAIEPTLTVGGVPCNMLYARLEALEAQKPDDWLLDGVAFANV